MPNPDRPHVVANPKPRDLPAPSVEEPVDPVPPLDPPSDVAAPELRSATGRPVRAAATTRAQQGAFLTTATGTRLRDTDHSLKAGRRGPVLLQDHHLREKITHFDHERIPERVVHARGVGAHGVFVSNGAAAKLSRAAFLQADVETPVFVRFSTVLGSRGSADTPRDTRGFAVKFYTSEGVFDLVGNNIPVFFIQDAIKFPDIIHAGKPEPDREIPQAASAHDTFWDFVSLHTEAQHHTIWNMSDRALPASLRTMEGFGVHTFHLVDEAGDTVLVKFHWKPAAGVHSQLWEEAQLTAGGDPDFQRRDLYDAIQNGALPSWTFGVQVFPDTEDETFEGIDLLDPTKIVPEELAPVQPIGTLTLTANPTNYFAETEQVAFHPGHLVPGIDVTNDPLLQGRLFSYLDTQLTRLGGPNFDQIPINRPHADVSDMLRDGFHQHAVHTGVAPYKPNSLDGGCPFHAGVADGAFLEVPSPVEGEKVREHPASFDDHFSQPRMFFRSLSPIEQEHVIAAYTFELSKVTWPQVRERQLAHLALIDERLCAEVAAGLGLPAPTPDPDVEVQDLAPSPALAQIVPGATYPVAGRTLGVVADASTRTADLQAVVDAAQAADLLVFVLGPHAGVADAADGTFAVDKPLYQVRSFELDAVVLTTATTPAADVPSRRDAKVGSPDHRDVGVDPRTLLLLSELFRQGKAIGALPDAAPALVQAGIAEDDPGVVVRGDAAAVTEQVLALVAQHRVWERLSPVG
ncbi:catalase [Miniimonas arenae]|uniref:Catalase n=1 Tax=Miniimonas arenae TaxID=676201 RepID=A0A5C5BBX0_9MICO|nr:catalase [Miniimonas arenae]TNU73687.1 catalase [Miniimonas arenae]